MVFFHFSSNDKGAYWVHWVLMFIIIFTLFCMFSFHFVCFIQCLRLIFNGSLLFLSFLFFFFFGGEGGWEKWQAGEGRGGFQSTHVFLNIKSIMSISVSSN